MNQDRNPFCRRLNQMLAVSGTEPGELACRLGVSVPTVNRWRNGSGVPDLYQFQALIRFFGMPCEWFLNTGGFPNAEELAARLGISKSAVSNYETGYNAVREDILLRLFDILEVDPNYLYQDSFNSQVLQYSAEELSLVQK